MKIMILTVTTAAISRFFFWLLDCLFLIKFFLRATHCDDLRYLSWLNLSLSI